MRSTLALPQAVTAVLVCACCGPTAAQWLNYPTPGIPRLADGKPNLAAPPPRTRDDKPDLSGIWQVNWAAVPASGVSLTNFAADLKSEEIRTLGAGANPAAQRKLHQRLSRLSLPSRHGSGEHSRYAGAFQDPPDRGRDCVPS